MRISSRLAISGVAGVTALLVFLTTFIGGPFALPKEQAIYWFILALLCFLLPHIESFQFGNAGIKFRSLQSQLRNLTEAVVGPPDNAELRPGEIETELQRLVIDSLRNERWAARTTSGVVGEVSGQMSVRREEVKIALKTLTKEGLVVRLTGNNNRLYWALSSRGKAAARELSARDS